MQLVRKAKRQPFKYHYKPPRDLPKKQKHELRMAEKRGIRENMLSSEATLLETGVLPVKIPVYSREREVKRRSDQYARVGQAGGR